MLNLPQLHRISKPFQTLQDDLALISELVQSPTPKRQEDCEEHGEALYGDDGG